MPYDRRLDGKDSSMPGTLTDFAARALLDFTQSILPEMPRADIEVHAKAISHRLADWRQNPRQSRHRLSDETILKLLRAHWSRKLTAGQMLRAMRDQWDIACEQSRFRRLFAQISSEMGGR